MINMIFQNIFNKFLKASEPGAAQVRLNGNKNLSVSDV